MAKNNPAPKTPTTPKPAPKVPNLPSKTGKPSGPGRNNLPAKKK